jgi:transcriptional regulator with XRE-family HTH domain
MATGSVKQGKARATGKILPSPLPRRVRGPALLSQMVRKEYGLSQRLFARLLGVARPTLAAWEKTGKQPRDARAKVRRVAGLLKSLSRIMPKADLGSWLTSPNDACSAGARSPADLMETGRYDKIEAMIYFFESGVAY